ncbi:MAG: hypothetical protein ABJF23_05820 [Bryobacteraceae bacterium]
MGISVFLSYPKPHLQVQDAFVERISSHLKGRGLNPRTLGVTDYDPDAPLEAIRRLMLASHGLITIAFRRTLIASGTIWAESDREGVFPTAFTNAWLTSPYCQIEPAMAYQLGLPTLLLRERGVIEEGLLEKGVVGSHMPEFDLSKPLDSYFLGSDWNELMCKWEGSVRESADAKRSQVR